MWIPSYQHFGLYIKIFQQNISNLIKIHFTFDDWLTFVLYLLYYKLCSNIAIALMWNRKLRKVSNELVDKMDSLSLDESKNGTEQRLSQLENVFSFSTADSSTFPKSQCQEFIQQIQHLPPGKKYYTLLISAKCIHFHIWFQSNMWCAHASNATVNCTCTFLSCPYPDFIQINRCFCAW